MQPLEQVLARVVELVFEMVPAERAFLLLRDSIDQPLSARVMRNRDGSVPAKVSISRTIVNTVMRDRVAMLAKDALYDTRLHASDSIQSMNVRSFMCAPLWNQNDVIGVLYCDNPRSKKFIDRRSRGVCRAVQLRGRGHRAGAAVAAAARRDATP